MKSKIRNRNVQTRHLQTESLEDRVLLAVTAGCDTVPAPEPAGIAIWTVNTLSDPESWDYSDTEISLREAIARASSGDTIKFKSTLAGGTITLSKTLSVSNGVKITAASIGGITLNGNNACKIMYADLSGSNGTLTLENLTFTHGYASGTDKGAGLHLAAGTVSITDCVFQDSKVTGSTATGTTRDGGGGIFNQSGTISMLNCTITGNKTNYFGGGIQNQTGTITMVNCLIADNSSGSPLGYGGGIYNVSGKITLNNCTVVGNSSAYGGGIYSFGTAGKIELVNSILLMNTASLSGPDLLTYESQGARSTVTGDSVLTTYTDWTSSENIYLYNDQRTLFADPENGDYSLAESSQAIDIGNDARVTSKTDLAGNARIFGKAVDLGAYEYSTAVSPKISVSLVISLETPKTAELEVLPENPSALVLGETVTLQVWVKNADGSQLGCTGGYVDLTFNTDVFKGVSWTASSVYPEESYYCTISKTGRVSMLGGCNTAGENDLGVDSWALLGYVTFTVIGGGTGEIASAIPTLNGIEYPSLNLTRAGVGTLTPAEIDFGSVSVGVSEDLDAPVILTGTDNYFASYGVNRHQITWAKSAGASSYEIQYSSDGSSWKSTYASGTSCVIGGLIYSDTMQYKVRALGPEESGIVSEWSETKKFTVCPVDVDGDGFIGPGDASYISYAWFSMDGDENWLPNADIDGDGFVGPGDASYVSANWFSLVDTDEIINPPYPAAIAER